MVEIYIIHKDWEGICILEKERIIRKNCNEEKGNYSILKNKMTIIWDKWGIEIFFYFDNHNYFYLEDIFNKKFNYFIFFEKNKILDCIINKENNTFSLIKNSEIELGVYKIDNNIITLELKNNIKIYKNIDTNSYCLLNDLETILFELKIMNNLITEKYIFNKESKKFYSTKNIENNGIYDIIDNSIYMEWNNGYKKKFYTNKYSSNNNSDINIIKPKKIIINEKVLFSNISLCKKKIILTSIHYKYNNWNIDNIKIIIKNSKIINKSIFNNNDDYEPSISIIIEIEDLLDNLFICINYDNVNYDFFLEQLKIKEHNISAMTLFNDDYNLLKKYLKYYSNLGVEIFFLYYNKIIDYQIIEKIMKLNENNVKLYLVEWNYEYWYNFNNIKYHHAQTMAINDSLNILKNYGNFILYNDLDEYIILKKYNNFGELIEENSDVDAFVFKNRFCKMSNELIKYEDFDKVFDLSNIIEGNYWDSGREKNLIKLKNINVMGVHKYFKNFSNEKIIEKVIDEFYHILNFKEKYREELMTKFIT